MNYLKSSQELKRTPKTRKYAIDAITKASVPIGEDVIALLAP
mgnify:CR=1 FL=1